MQKINKVIKDNVMNEIKSGKIKMKPKSYFIIGYSFLFLGLISSFITSVFAVSIISFILRPHGPMRDYRLGLMINSFPWYIPLVAIVGVIVGLFLLKKFDFSYKKNFWVLIIIFVFSILITGFFLDLTGLNIIWLKRGPMNSVIKSYYLNNETGQGIGNGYGRQVRKGWGN
jgi:hypothetical protein